MVMMLNVDYDKQGNVLHFGGVERFTITSPERKILITLLKMNCKVCSREILIKKAWINVEYIGPNSLNVAISNLRKILKPKGINIVTLPKQGYMIETQINNVKINGQTLQISLNRDSIEEDRYIAKFKEFVKNGMNFFLETIEKITISNLIWILIITICLHCIFFVYSNFSKINTNTENVLDTNNYIHD